MASIATEDSADNRKDNMDFETKDTEVYKKVIFEPIRIGPVSTLEEMDSKVLQFQNKKLQIKLHDHQRIESELQLRIEQLDKRQSQDKIVLSVVNQYWDQLNDDVKTMLLQFDDECQNTVDRIEDEATLSFIKTLATCAESQIDHKLMDAVQISTATLTKIIQAYDYVLAKSEKTLAVLKSTSDDTRSFRDTSDSFDVFSSFDNESIFLENDEPSNQAFESKHMGCIDGLESVSESETSDSTDKLIKASICSLVTDDVNSLHSSEPTSKKLRSSSSCKGDSNHQVFAAVSDIDPSVIEVVSDMINEVVRKYDTLQHDQSKEDRRDKFYSDISDSFERMDNEDDDVFVSNTCKIDHNESQVALKADKKKKTSSRTSLVQELKSVSAELSNENIGLQNIIDTFHEQYERSTENEQYILEALDAKEQELDEWRTRVDDIEYENDKLKCRKFKIERNLTEAADMLEKMKLRERTRVKSDTSVNNGKKFEELEEELELQRELALNRSQELDSLRARYQSNLDAIEELEKSLNDLPDTAVENTAEYVCLQSQFSVLYNDTIQIKDQIEEYHAHIQTLNATFANKMEMTETEDLMTLRKLQTDLLQMQQINSQLRREYQSLKVEFEKNLIANEQTGPLNKEMRYLLVRLQKHNKHLKHEAQRYKRKYKELNAELNLLSKQSYSDSKFKLEAEGGSGSDFDDIEYSLDISEDFLDVSIKEEPSSGSMKKEKIDPARDESTLVPVSLYERPLMAIAIKQEPSELSPPESPPSEMTPLPRKYTASLSKPCSKMSRKRHCEPLHEYHDLLNNGPPKESLHDYTPEIDEADNEKLSDDEYMQDLKNQLKKAETEQKELKLLLDMYKSVNRDKREKMHLMCAEKKLKADIEDTKNQMRRILEIKRENRKKMADEDALRKIKYLEEQNFLLLRQINVHKQEEEALLSEMEVTNQAFEDMQEQNSRLIQQLREKDDANSKLMAERIKSNLLYKITREEMDSLQNLISATSKQLDSVTTVMNELEEKEQVYQTAINNVEKEINLRQQALDQHRKKALEHAQLTSELKLNLEKHHTETTEAKQQIAEKMSSLEAETFKHSRLQEEVSMLRRRVERMKKLEPSETPDIVLVEEIREYKEMLTCQTCKVRRKDAVLSKCFHVFCWECLRTRYETRQRKCPKCNATFGANDYHRLFFAS